ncbi:MAG TPA: alpha-mannosidase, partial [Candidatus Hydrogenedentes bacterium]|nr:alpha-mannosidase [Candidatus Hydrogenedentota bacterium]
MKAFYCVGTHWDREWYEPFQEFRIWLVELIDELMDLMEKDPRYLCFHLDGQTIVIEDYLEIRPERRERLLRLLKERRLLIGPWYNLPDEWLVSGESLIRNMMRGYRMCRELGVAPLDFAYTPDQFGHIAALPMIMSGFGLRTGIVWRGTQDETCPAHFVWAGPDGSRLVYYKLMDKGSYGPFDLLARTPIKKAGNTDESFKEYFEPYLAEEQARGAAPVVLMLDAVDHQRPDREMPGFLEELRHRYPAI